MPDVNAVVIKIKNFGTIVESEVRYAVAGTCAIDANGDGDTLDCGSVVYSAACTGSVGPLAPGQVISVAGCTVTYGVNLPADTGDKWTHVNVITHCGTDGVGVCSTNDGAADANPGNQNGTKTTRVLP